MLINIDTMDVGKIIFNLRNERGLTQEELSEGICSISYLSKLEHNQIKYSDEILSLLFQKLNVDENKLYTKHKNFNDNVSNLSKFIDMKNYTDTENCYSELNNLVNEIKDPNSICNYHITKLKYFLAKRNLESARTTIDYINEFFKRKSVRQEALFIDLCGVYFSIKGNFVEGLKFFKDAERIALENNLNVANIFYHLGLTYSQIHNDTLAIHYAQNALKLFESDMNYLKCIDCQLIISLKFVRNQNFRSAEKIYFDILEQAKIFTLPKTKAITLHNLGFLYYKVKDYNQSVNYFVEALEYKSPKNEDYILSIYYLCNALMEDDRNKEVIFWLNKALHYIEKNEHLKEYKYSYMVKLYKYKYEDFDKYIEFAENVVFPYLISIKTKELILSVGNLLIEYYNSKHRYKRSNNFYKIMLEFMEVN
ncbi:helix-turn-helix transcriptional regulator [Virgibacillus sp. C22-A2]|uniref:Helix-turn-helix transcriptional regulator n=1 Tax=Virgibacillus tibetensis TaxID=3042313 RepID=A0ABU6KJE1_9BACI|nr:helix-turn-helix transcriptional regulator [Virgibacillus sp. C22-A2]